jgi:hypothetical protein
MLNMSSVTWIITNGVQHCFKKAIEACSKILYTRDSQAIVEHANGLPGHFSRLPAELKIIIFSYVYADYHSDHALDIEISEASDQFDPLDPESLAYYHGTTPNYWYNIIMPDYWYNIITPDFPLVRYISSRPPRGAMIPLHVSRDWRRLIRDTGLIERNAEFRIFSAFHTCQKCIPSLEVDLRQSLSRIRHLRLNEDAACLTTPQTSTKSLYHLLHKGMLPRLQHVTFTNAQLYGSIHTDYSRTNLTHDEIDTWQDAFLDKKVLDTIPFDWHRDMDIPCTLQHVAVGLVGGDCPLFADFFPASYDPYFAEVAKMNGMQKFFSLAARKGITITLEFHGVSIAPPYIFSEDIGDRQVEEFGKREPLHYAQKPYEFMRDLSRWKGTMSTKDWIIRIRDGDDSADELLHRHTQRSQTSNVDHGGFYYEVVQEKPFWLARGYRCSED